MISLDYQPALIEECLQWQSIPLHASVRVFAEVNQTRATILDPTGPDEMADGKEEASWLRWAPSFPPTTM